MKTTIKIFTLVLVLSGFALSANAQVTANAAAAATIVTPIAITKDVDMNFGNIAVQSSNGGTVVLATTGTRSQTGGVTLPATAGTVTAASFTVTGQEDYTYAITLPTSPVTITRGGGSETMTINNFVSDPSGTGTLSGGSEVVNVGATLNVAAGQLAGLYSGTFSVTVNYN